MDEPITVNYRWTANELITARKYHFRHACRPVFRWLLSLIAICSILAGWGYYAKSGLSWGTFTFPLLGVYWLFFRGYDRRWVIRRQFRKRPDKDLALQWIATEDGFSIKTSESESKCTWKLITKAARTREGFLIYPNENLFYWLPFHAFASPSQIDSLEQILQQQISRYTLVR